MAGNSNEADIIHEYLNDYCRGIPHLRIMRNDVYTRFSHAAYNKGTALAELARRLAVTASEVFAAGDHFNDLPMLSRQHAWWLVAPRNAIEEVKRAVRRQNGFVSHLPCGAGVAQGLAFHLAQAGS
jgi:hydroxymethylpyrimidine pyrophosphatase-like HAD family hydrolase